MIDIRTILDEPIPKAHKMKLLRKYKRDYERMRSALCVLHTWCKHDATRTTHGQIVSLIDGVLGDLEQ